MAVDVDVLGERDVELPGDAPLRVGPPAVRRPHALAGEDVRDRTLDSGLAHRRGEVAGHDDPLGALAEPGVDLGEADRRPVGMAVAAMAGRLDDPPEGHSDRRRAGGRRDGDALPGDQRAIVEHDVLRLAAVHGDGDRLQAPDVAQPVGLQHGDVVDARRDVVTSRY